ncbi:MAG: YciI family protein [Solirubrobacteraceae bacterium]
MAERLYALFYDYVEDVVERRGPYRQAHLDLIGRWHADGRVALGGALGDPPHSGLIVFRVADAAEVGAFVADDPYVQNGIVVGHRVEPWNVVT